MGIDPRGWWERSRKLWSGRDNNIDTASKVSSYCVHMCHHHHHHHHRHHYLRHHHHGQAPHWSVDVSIIFHQLVLSCALLCIFERPMFGRATLTPTYARSSLVKSLPLLQESKSWHSVRPIWVVFTFSVHHVSNISMSSSISAFAAF